MTDHIIVNDSAMKRRRPFGVSVLAVFFACEGVIGIILAFFLHGAATLYVLGVVPIFGLIAYGLWRLDNRARWACAVVVVGSVLYIFDGARSELSVATIAALWIWTIVYLMLPKVGKAFSGNPAISVTREGTSEVYRAAMNDDQLGAAINPRQAKEFFVSRILEQGRVENVELSRREMEFLSFEFRHTATWKTLVTDTRIFEPSGLKLSALLERALRNDKGSSSCSDSRANAVYRRRWKALKEPWFKRIIVDYWGSRNPDAFIYDIVHRALGRDLAFWSSLDWIAAIFSIVVCLIVVAVLILLIIYY